MSRVSTASLNTVHQSRYSAAPKSTDLFPSSIHWLATGAGGVLKFGPTMQPAPTNASPRTTEYSRQNPPLIPLGQRGKLQKQREKFFSAFFTRTPVSVPSFEEEGPGTILVSCSTLNFSSSCSFSYLRGERGAPLLCRRAFRDRPSTPHR